MTDETYEHKPTGVRITKAGDWYWIVAADGTNVALTPDQAVAIKAWIGEVKR